MESLTRELALLRCALEKVLLENLLRSAAGENLTRELASLRRKVLLDKCGPQGLRNGTAEPGT